MTSPPPLSSVHCGPKALGVHREWTESMPIFYIQKIIPYPIKPLEDCTEAPVFVVKLDLAPVFVFLNKI
jgi:hypothetical protein